MARRTSRHKRRRRKTEKETRKIEVTRHDKHGHRTRLRHHETERVRRRPDGGARVDCHRHIRFDCPPPLPRPAVHFRHIQVVRPPPVNPHFVKRHMPAACAPPPSPPPPPRMMRPHLPPYHFVPSAPHRFVPHYGQPPSRNHGFVGGPWY